MKRLTLKKWLVFSCVFSVLMVSGAQGVHADALWPETWWPSKWGADDQKGAFNTITPEKVKAALKLAEQGKIYRLGMIYESGMPLFGNRTFSLTIPGMPSGGPVGNNKVVWNDEFVVGELGQIGTQFDGPGHIGIVGDDEVARWYN